MASQSAGILLYRIIHDEPEVLLVHPGGPFWAKKDIGAWSLPKGEFDEPELVKNAAIREFKEETGADISGELTALKPVKLKSGKIVFAFAVEEDLNTASFVSNSFEMEWPPRSGKKKNFPEVDKWEWFSIVEAKEKIIPAMVPLLDELVKLRK